MYFPTPQPDELLGSALARFVSDMGSLDSKVATTVLFGQRNVVTSALLQGHIDQLLDNIGHLWNTEASSVVSRHTILPLNRPFVSPGQYTSYENDLRGTSLNRSFVRTGMSASRLRWPRYFRICPVCQREQRQLLGFNYWQRVLQCPGVVLCPMHGCPTVETRCARESPDRHQFICTPEFDIPDSVKWVKSNVVFLQMSKLVHALLTSGDLPSPTIAQWTSYYQRLARNSGMVRGKNIAHDQIAARVRRMFGERWLDEVGLSLNHRNHWLLAMFRKHRRRFTYLEHFVCWLALDRTIPVLQDRLAYVAQLPDSESPNSIYKNTNYDRRVDSYRQLWQQLREQFGSLRDIRCQREGKRVYSWLFRFDRLWLRENMPQMVTTVRHSKVDWKARDCNIVRQLIRVERATAESLDAPRRSRRWYSNQVGRRSMLEKKIFKLPLCGMFLSRYAETIDEYQCRRIARVVIDMRSQGRKGYIARHEVERTAGISNERARAGCRYLLENCLSAWQSVEKIPQIYTAREPRKS